MENLYSTYMVDKARKKGAGRLAIRTIVINFVHSFVNWNN